MKYRDGYYMCKKTFPVATATFYKGRVYRIIWLHTSYYKVAVGGSDYYIAPINKEELKFFRRLTKLEQALKFGEVIFE